MKNKSNQLGLSDMKNKSNQSGPSDMKNKSNQSGPSDMKNKSNQLGPSDMKNKSNQSGPSDMKNKSNKLGPSLYFAMEDLWETSHSMVKYLQSKHTFDNTDDNMDNFIREIHQRAIQPGGNAPTTDQSTLTKTSHEFVQRDDNSKGQLAPIDVGIGMKPMANMGKEKEKTVKAHAENGSDTEYETEAMPFMESGPETETEIAQDNETEGDILMEFAEKVVGVMDMIQDVKSILSEKKKKTKTGTRQTRIRRSKNSIEETDKNTMKGKIKGGPDASHQSEASRTSNLKSTVNDRKGFSPRLMQMRGVSPTTSPQIDTMNNLPVRYKTPIYSTPTADPGLGPAGTRKAQ
jgi:hypothetical protein